MVEEMLLLMERKKRCGSHPHWSWSSLYHCRFSDAFCFLQIYHHYYCTFLIIILLHGHCFPSSPSLGFSFLLSRSRKSPIRLHHHSVLSFLLSMTTTKRAYKLRILPFPSLLFIFYHYYFMLQIRNLLFICILRRRDLKFAVDVILIYFPCTPSDLINDFIFSFQIYKWAV